MYVPAMIKSAVLAGVSLLLLLSLVRVSSGQSCCGVSLFTSAGSVVIDTSFDLQGLYTAVKVAFCAVGNYVYIQLWQKLNDDGQNYQLRWQMEPYYPSYQGEYVINLPQPVNISAGWKLGFYSPTAPKHSVPYASSSTTTPTIVSGTSYIKVFQINATIVVGSVASSATFLQYIRFCTDADCPELALTSLLTNASLVGPAGPPGPVGPPGSCSSLLSDSTATAIQQLSQDVSTILSQVNNLTQANKQTQASFVAGTCPQGFTAGTYGLGNCYSFQQQKKHFLEAVQACHDLSSNLVVIQSQLENDFVKSLMSGMVATPAAPLAIFANGVSYRGTWIWLQKTEYSFVYTNWANSAASLPVYGDKTCLQLLYGGSQLIWQSANIDSDTAYYVCETVKQCL